MSEQKFDLEKFRKASYLEQLKMLIDKAQREHDIFAMMRINDELKNQMH